MPSSERNAPPREAVAAAQPSSTAARCARARARLGLVGILFGSCKDTARRSGNRRYCTGVEVARSAAPGAGSGEGGGAGGAATSGAGGNTAGRVGVGGGVAGAAMGGDGVAGASAASGEGASGGAGAAVSPGGPSAARRRPQATPFAQIGRAHV